MMYSIDNNFPTH